MYGSESAVKTCRKSFFLGVCVDMYLQDNLIMSSGCVH